MAKRKADEGTGNRPSFSGRDRDDFRSDIGRRLRHIREEVAGQSVARFAGTVGVGKSTVDRYEAGERVPDAWFLHRIGRTYAISLDWLVDGRGPMRIGGTAGGEAPYGAGPGHRGQVDLELLELILGAVRRELSDLTVTLKPEAEARVVRLLYQLYADRRQRPETETVAEVIRLAAYR